LRALKGARANGVTTVMPTFNSRSVVGTIGLSALALFTACQPGKSLDAVAGDDDESDAEPVAEGEPETMLGVTAAHNQVRAFLSKTLDKPLSPLVWDAEVAKVAQAYADGCAYGHSQGEYGENLYAAAGKLASAQEVVGAWAAEVENYDYASGSCSGKCGHYTQVVWRDSQRVGCGVAECKTGSPFEGFTEWQYWVCNYDPPGNWQGEKPY